MMWTMEQDDQLRAMHAETPRPTCAKMGERIGCTKNAIIGRRSRIGLAGPKRIAKPRNRSPNRPKAKSRMSKWRLAMLAAPVFMGPAPGSGTKNLLDLKSNECRFPFGDGPYTFCGCEAVDGLPYCAGHARIAYGRVVIERARAKMSRFGNWVTNKVEG